MPTTAFTMTDAQTEHNNFAFYIPAPKWELAIQNELDDLCHDSTGKGNNSF